MPGHWVPLLLHSRGASMQMRGQRLLHYGLRLAHGLRPHLLTGHCSSRDPFKEIFLNLTRLVPGHGGLQSAAEERPPPCQKQHVSLK